MEVYARVKEPSTRKGRPRSKFSSVLSKLQIGYSMYFDVDAEENFYKVAKNVRTKIYQASAMYADVEGKKFSIKKAKHPVTQKLCVGLWRVR